MPIIEDGDVFKLTIRHEAEVVGVNDGVNVGVNVGVKDVSDLILTYITQKPGINANEITGLINNKTKRTIERHIGKLKDLGKIEFRGAHKTGGYFMINPEKDE